MAKTLKEYREIRGVTQYQAADDLGIAQPQYSRVENGKARPSLALAKRIQDWSDGEVEMSSWAPA